MKKAFSPWSALLALPLLLVLFAAPPACAGDAGEGAGFKGLSVFLGYEGSQLHYAEKTGGGDLLDKDTGWMNGSYAELRYDFPRAFLRLKGDVQNAGSARYDGTFDDGTPCIMVTQELMGKGEFDAAYKIYESGGLTLAPYLGIGYRHWRRGDNRGDDYVVDYHWWYGALGVNLAYRLGRLVLGLDAALRYPWDMVSSTTINGKFDPIRHRIQPEFGTSVEVPILYDLGTIGAVKTSLFLTPYYEHWGIGKSATIPFTSGGEQASIYWNGTWYDLSGNEPRSSTDILGFRAGIGFNF